MILSWLEKENCHDDEGCVYGRDDVFRCSAGRVSECPRVSELRRIGEDVQFREGMPEVHQGLRESCRSQAGRTDSVSVRFDPGEAVIAARKFGR